MLAKKVRVLWKLLKPSLYSATKFKYDTMQWKYKDNKYNQSLQKAHKILFFTMRCHASVVYAIIMCLSVWNG